MLTCLLGVPALAHAEEAEEEDASQAESELVVSVTDGPKEVLQATAAIDKLPQEFETSDGRTVRLAFDNEEGTVVCAKLFRDDGPAVGPCIRSEGGAASLTQRSEAIKVRLDLRVPPDPVD